MKSLSIFLISCLLLTTGALAKDDAKNDEGGVENPLRLTSFDLYNKVLFCVPEESGDVLKLRVRVVGEEDILKEHEMMAFMRAACTRPVVRGTPVMMVEPIIIIFSGPKGVPPLGVRFHVSAKPDSFVAERISVENDERGYLVSEAALPSLVNLGNDDWKSLSPEARKAYLETRFVRMKDLAGVVRSRFYEGWGWVWKKH